MPSDKNPGHGEVKSALRILGGILCEAAGKRRCCFRWCIRMIHAQMTRASVPRRLLAVSPATFFARSAERQKQGFFVAARATGQHFLRIQNKGDQNIISTRSNILISDGHGGIPAVFFRTRSFGRTVPEPTAWSFQFCTAVLTLRVDNTKKCQLDERALTHVS